MKSKKKTDKVAEYYNVWTQRYIDAGYGDIIQAHRPPDANKLLSGICEITDIKDGQKILDAGCGVCGPAIYIAKNFNVEITAITNSTVQAEIAKNNVSETILKGKIDIFCQDFHNIDCICKKDTFDLILMLESYGHAVNKEKLLNAASRILRKNGLIYIKDYFQKEITGPPQRKKGMLKAIKRMNKSYVYDLANLNKTISILRKNDLDLQLIRKNPLPVLDQEFVKIFEDVNNIDLFDGGFHYLFLEPLELLFKKPFEIDSAIK